MTGGLLRGLDNEHAAKFAFLLATPIILAAGIFKFSDLTGPLGDHGVRRAAVIAAVAAAVAAVVTRPLPAALLPQQQPDPVRRVLPAVRDGDDLYTSV